MKHMKHEWTDKMWNLPLSASAEAKITTDGHLGREVCLPVPSIANRFLKKIWEKPRGNDGNIWEYDHGIAMYFFDVTNYEHIIFGCVWNGGFTRKIP